MSINLHIIKDQETYNQYLKEYEAFFDNEPQPGTPNADRFEMLGLLLNKYEEDRHPLTDVSPVQSIQFAMERLGLGQKDLAQVLNSRSRASEILQGRRNLTLEQIRLLHSHWNIPLTDLIGLESSRAA